MSALWVAALLTAAPLTAQTEVFFNARVALRSRQPADTLRLWMLHNSLWQRGQPGSFEPEFQTAVWVALGDLGLCPDGLPTDEGRSAHLWPLAVHNWLLLAAARPPPDAPSPPFEAFESERQQRLVSLSDVLDGEELNSLTFFPTECDEPYAALMRAGLQPPALKSEDLFNDRLATGTVMRALLEHSLTHVAKDQVTSLAVIETRLFDLNLELARLEAAKLREAAMAAMERARTKGASPEAMRAVKVQVEKWSPTSRQVVFLRQAMTWRPAEWLALSKERRLALFARAKPFAEPPARDALALALIDALIARREGAEVNDWISLFEAGVDRRSLLVAGDRGERLLTLDASTGFTERGPIALARGVMWLEKGDRREALRSFALALRTADESRSGSDVAGLARRWLSYVLGFFETDDEILATLKALVPALEYNAVIEELVWKAALHADASSFELLAASTRRGGSFDARVALLRPLAQGKSATLVDTLAAMSVDEPHAMLRFLDAALAHVEAEDVEVRRALSEFLTSLNKLLDGFLVAPKVSKAQIKRSEGLAARVHAILAGLGKIPETVAGRARSLTPGQPAFAGNVRLAPSDELPWPFPLIEPNTPSPFRPIVLTPLEWRTTEGKLVFGWSVTE